MEQRTRGLRKIARFSSVRSKVPVDSLVEFGDVGKTIVEIGTKINADLIIMGTHGASGFVEELLGSTTYHVSTLATIPVMSVHRGAGRLGYGHVVYPVREETRAMEKFPYALAYAQMGNARVDVVGFLRLGQAQRMKKMRALCASIKREFKRFGIVARTVYTSNEHFADGTIRYVYPNSLVVIFQDADFRLVDMFRKSFTKRILHKTLSPVLTVPTPKRT